MDKIAILLISFAVIAAVIIISRYYTHKRQQKRIGKVIVVVYLDGFKKKTTRKIAFPIALAIILLIEFGLFLLDETDLVILVQGSAMGLLTSIVVSSNRIYFGENGFYGAGFKFRSIDDIKYVKWDNDIGQMLWGVKIYFNRSSKPLKLYVPKEHKNDLESYFSKMNYPDTSS